MSVNSIIFLRASAAAGLLQSIFRPPWASGDGSTKSKSTDGATKAAAVFVLGDPAQGLPTGLYSSLGSLISAGGNAADTSGTVPSSIADEQRQVALKSAAEKINTGDLQGGRMEAQGLLKKNVNDIAALRVVADSYLAEQDYKHAERIYTRGLQLAPNNARLQADLQDVRTLQKSDKEVLSVARRKLASAAQRGEGLRLLVRLVDRSPDNAEAFAALADGFSAARMPRQVVGALQEAVKHADKEQIDEVVDQAETLVRKYPNVGLTHNLLGRALQKAGRFDDAITELKDALAVEPENIAYADDLADVYVARADTKRASGNARSAETDLQAARGLAPPSRRLNEVTARVAFDRAREYILAGRYAGAVGKLNTAANNAPDDAEFKKDVAFLYLRAAIHFEKTDADAAALANYVKAYELDASSTVARQRVGQLSHDKGLSALDAKNYDAAITHLERAYGTYRADATYGQDLARAYDLRGQQQVSLGKLDEALEDFKRGIEVDPSNSSLSANYSAAVLQTGET